MSQQGLSGLAILSIGKDMLEKIDYKSVINNFASKTRRNSNNFSRFEISHPDFVSTY